MSTKRPRDPVAGPDSGPEAPYPLKLEGPVIQGFGRGSKELGIPTANIPINGLDLAGHKDLTSGVYFGWAGLESLQPGHGTRPSSTSDGTPSTSTTAVGTGQGHVYPMVMSIGWNPYYKNSVRSVEVHILEKFHQDFYGAKLKLLIMGFIRPELDYVSVEALVEDINYDCEVAKRSLQRGAYETLKGESWLLDFS